MRNNSGTLKTNSGLEEANDAENAFIPTKGFSN